MQEFNNIESTWEDAEEIQHIYAVIDSFHRYRQTGHLRTTHVRRQGFYSLPTADWNLLSAKPVSFLDTLNRVDEAIDANGCIAEAIAEAYVESVGLVVGADQKPPWTGMATPLDLDKARSTLHQLYRDWSASGAVERNACFDPIFEALRSHVPLARDGPRKVLVPGCGLGRLVYELVRAGYCAEGNELSYHQVMAQSYVMNKIDQIGSKVLYPFALSFANVRSRVDQLRQVTFPDVPTGTSLRLAKEVTMSVTMGDFCEVYSNADVSSCFDAVATVFFLDTTNNALRYIRTVKHCLKPGGVWSNVGPLLWHHAGSQSSEQGTDGDPNFGSVELSDEEVVSLVQLHGFTIVMHEPGQPTGYVQNPASMLQSTYHPSCWTAIKTS